jgi:hypothetical protein
MFPNDIYFKPNDTGQIDTNSDLFALNARKHNIHNTKYDKNNTSGLMSYISHEF